MADSAVLTESASPADPVSSAHARWLRFGLLSPAIVVGLLVIVLHRWTQYTSDSVAQQSLMRTWLDHGHGTAWVPADTWILKLPLYLVVELLPLAPGARLLADVLLLNVASMLLLALAAWWLARVAAIGQPSLQHARLTGVHRVRALQLAGIVVPLIWVGTIGGELGANRMQPNYRNVELGLMFLALAIAARYLDRPPKSTTADDVQRRPRSVRSAGVWLAAVLLLTLLWLDDPYFALLTGLPLAGLCIAWMVLRRRELRLLAAATAVIASLVLIVPGQRLLGAFGLLVVPGSADTELGHAALQEHWRLLRLSILAQLGLSDSDPASIVPGTGTVLSPLAAGLTGALMVVAVLTGVALTVHGWRRRLILPAFLGLHWIVVAAGFMVSSRVGEVAHGRYLILAWYDLGVTLAVILPAALAGGGTGPGERCRWVRAGARGVVLLLVVSAVLNVACAIWTAPRIEAHGWDRQPPSEAGPNNPGQERAIQDALTATGLRRGYAQFWSANINLYRSSGMISMNSVRCADGQLVTDNWLTDTARRTAPAPGGTFLVYEPSSAIFKGCGQSELLRQFGSPARTIAAGPAIVYVFGTDIGRKLPAWDPVTRLLSE